VSDLIGDVLALGALAGAIYAFKRGADQTRAEWLHEVALVDREYESRQDHPKPPRVPLTPRAKAPWHNVAGKRMMGTFVNQGDQGLNEPKFPGDEGYVAPGFEGDDPF
jgi:hypothetical protein